MQSLDVGSIIGAMAAESENVGQQNNGNEERVVRMLRRFMLAILVLAMTGTFVDLLLFRHYEDAWQMIPLCLLGLAGVTLIWHGIGRGSMGLKAFQIMMVLLVAGGVTGVIMHWKTSAEFHSELDSRISMWQMAWRVLHSKVPPTLAPAGLVQMGLLGLAYTYRHPAFRRRSGVGK